MAAIAHASRVNITNQTTTSGTYVDATNGDIASGSFTTGDKYLILAMAQLGVNNSFQSVWMRVVQEAQALTIASSCGLTARLPEERLTSGGQCGRLLVVRTSIFSTEVTLTTSLQHLSIL
jgi:hypothetical protein